MGNKLKPKVGEIWEARLWGLGDIGLFLIISSKNRHTTRETAVNGLAIDWAEMEDVYYGDVWGWNITPIRRIEEAE